MIVRTHVGLNLNTAYWEKKTKKLHIRNQQKKTKHIIKWIKDKIRNKLADISTKSNILVNNRNW